MTAFYGAMSFLATQPIASLELQGKALPAGWEAAIPNHGKFLQGYLISNHSVIFALTIALLVGTSLLLYQVQKAQSVQREASGSAGAKAHTLAHSCVFAVLALAGYLLVTQVLVGVDAG